MRSRTRVMAALVPLALAAALTGCGGGDDDAATAPATSEPPDASPSAEAPPAASPPAPPDAAPSGAPGTGGALAPLPDTLLGLEAGAESVQPPGLPPGAQASSRGYVGDDGARVLDVLVIDAGQELDPAVEVPSYFQGLQGAGALLPSPPEPVEAGPPGGEASCADFVQQDVTATACVAVAGPVLVSLSDYRTPGAQEPGATLREIREALGV